MDLLICCGVEFPERLGKYGCANCLGAKKARASQNVTPLPQALLECDVENPRAQTLHFPRQEIF